MTHKELKEIKERAKKATPGPWVWRVPGYLCNKYIDALILDSNCTCKCDSGVWSSGVEDSDFIAHARTDIPKLIEALEEANEKLRVVGDSLEILMTDKNNCGCEASGPMSPGFTCGGHLALEKIGRAE